MLRKPAGDDAAFSSYESIKKNYDAFIVKANSSFKELHKISIGAIIDIDEQIGKNRYNKIEEDKINSLVFFRHLWRKINDSLAWIMLGDKRHAIKRLCFYQERGPLINHNPKETFQTLTELNADPYAMAILCDATTCIDIGDVLMVNRKTGTVEFIELKHGKVNKKMMDAMDCDRALYYFMEEYGEKGEKQILRYAKQMEKGIKALHVIKNDKGIDHITGKEMSIIEIKTPDFLYDEQLSSIIKKAREESTAINLIDGCLWIGAYIKRDFCADDYISSFSKEIIKKNPFLKERIVLDHGVECLRPINFITEGLYYHVSYPIFLKNIGDTDIVDIISGNVVIMFYWDWDGFIKLINNLGGKFEWSSKKQGRRENAKPAKTRCLVVDERIPIISKGEATMHMGCTSMVRTFFDGIRPEAIAGQEIDVLDYLLSNNK